jgi:hypothetical protein
VISELASRRKQAVAQINADALQIYSHLVPSLQTGAMDKLGARMQSLALADCNQIATRPTKAKKKPRRSEVLMVAGTGFEPVTFGL